MPMTDETAAEIFDRCKFKKELKELGEIVEKIDDELGISELEEEDHSVAWRLNVLEDIEKNINTRISDVAQSLNNLADKIDEQNLVNRDKFNNIFDLERANQKRIGDLERRFENTMIAIMGIFIGMDKAPATKLIEIMTGVLMQDESGR